VRATKSKPLPVAGLKLAENFRPSDNERAVASRLIRTLREGGYWLGTFIEWLLYIDASSGVYRVTIAEVKRELEVHSTAKGDDDLWRNKLMAAHPAAFAKTASGDAAGKQTDAFPDDEEEQFYQLLKQWRLTYPEPTKRQQAPKGRTQHEMDPDSD
jgi:hypothetical protein